MLFFDDKIIIIINLLDKINLLVAYRMVRYTTEHFSHVKG